jgi:hypothetical protein
VADKDRRRRTPWFPRSINPVHPGTYECGVRISSSVPTMLWELEWDGRGFLVPFPMIVRQWRGLVKRPDGVKENDRA